MTTKTLALNNIEQKIFWILAILLGIATSFFIYSAFSITLSGVARDANSRALHELAVTSSVLEQEYLSQSGKITLAFAKDLGFQEVNARYASDPSMKLSVAR